MEAKKTSEAQNRATKKWKEKNRKTRSVLLTFEENALLEKAAEAEHESINGIMRKALAKYCCGNGDRDSDRDTSISLLANQNLLREAETILSQTSLAGDYSRMASFYNLTTATLALSALMSYFAIGEEEQISTIVEIYSAEVEIYSADADAPKITVLDLYEDALKWYLNRKRSLIRCKKKSS